VKDLTLERFRHCTGAPKDRAELYYEPTIRAMDRFKIAGLEPVCAFLGTITVESDRLQAVEESLYYRDPERIVKLYLRVFDEDKDRRADPEEVEKAKGFVKNHAGLSKLLYKGYHGRGLIQLTWEANYALATMALGHDYVGNPDLVLEPEHAALTAAWFFSDKGCIEVSRSMRAVTAKVNPALMHLVERQAAYELALETLA
jgi:putative chitinase